MTAQKLLTEAQTQQKIRRIAFEIYENNYSEKEIVLAGIIDKGYDLAVLIKNELAIVSNVTCNLIKISLDKFAPLQSEIVLDVPLADLKGKNIIIVDDVLNSGRTLAYSLKPFLNVEIKKLQIAVLVDRGYKSFPVSADFVGYSLSTTLKEHVDVVLSKNENFGVYLN